MSEEQRGEREGDLKGAEGARVDLSIAGVVATITLDDPRTGNALSWRTHREIGRALDCVPASVAFVVLTGAGGVFSSGGHLGDLADGLPEDYVEDYWERMRGTVLRVRAMPQIVISIVDGPAVGAGAALALAADLTIASHRARFRWTFVRLGLLPDAGSTTLLQRAVGPMRARELLLRGRWMSADEALSSGLINVVARDGGIAPEVAAMLRDLRLADPRALALTKQVVEANAHSDLDSSVRREGVYQQAAAARSDYADRAARALHHLNPSAAPTTKENP